MLEESARELPAERQKSLMRCKMNAGRKLLHAFEFDVVVHVSTERLRMPSGDA